MDAAYMGCKEFAVVAFWDLDKDTDLFICKRFFIAPSPMSRTVKDCDGTKIEQVLFTSHHTKDVFFFYKGREIQ